MDPAEGQVGRTEQRQPDLWRLDQGVVEDDDPTARRHLWPVFYNFSSFVTNGKYSVIRGNVAEPDETKNVWNHPNPDWQFLIFIVPFIRL